ncbi:MAG TPA: glycosyl hydrolase [Acidimicrobiales bacterium]|nr:glycosyl hydrolase [Acidimicrobiales bacterium]
MTASPGALRALMVVNALCLGLGLLALPAVTEAQAVPGPGTYEDDNPAVAYTGSWSSTIPFSADSGGSTRYTYATGGAAELRFAGTAVQWVARRQLNAGISDVFIDGARVATVDLFNPTTQYKQVVFERTGLAPGEHTIRVVRTGTRNPAATNTLQFLDAFVVLAGPGTYEDDNPAVAYTGSWSSTIPFSGDSGGSTRYTYATGGAAELRFAGTAIQWVARRQLNAGISDVFIDGARVATVDLFNPTTQYKQVVFERTGLAPGEHTIRIVRTGTKNLLSTNTLQFLDAFVVSDQAPTVGAGTYEDDSSAVRYTGSWRATLPFGGDSGGSTRYTDSGGGAAELRFSGTAVQWVARRQPNAGVSDVLVDGAKVASVDLYSVTTQYKQVVFERAGLAPGEHTIRVVRTGTKHASSSYTFHFLDAFVVSDGPTATTSTTTTSTTSTSTTTTSTTTTSTTSTTVPPPSSSVLFGVSTPSGPYNLGELDAFERDAGKKAGLLMYYEGWPYHEFSADRLRTIASRGTIPMITWEPWDYVYGLNQPTYSLASTIAGLHDAYIRRWAEAAKAYEGTVLLRFAHEMNASYYPWSEGVNGNLVPGQYVQMWRHVVGIFRAVGATNVKWVWNPNISYYGTTPLAQLYPGDDWVDWVALDGYNGGSELPWGGWLTFAEVFGPTLRELAAITTSKPVMIGETASVEGGGSKAEWIRGKFAELERHPEIKAFVWFNHNKEADWRIQSSESARQSFADGVAKGRYG